MTVLEIEPTLFARGARDQLTDAALALANEYRAIPPGSVLRCFLRAVRASRRTGTAPRDLPTVARETADAMLRSRSRGSGVMR